ncbi:MAG: hypothetical protein JW981_08625 [Anaerolineae bacterium]|nr:hypothetical protein [Anaerolineae bacterium]
MGTYGLEGVLRAWDMGKITTEQAIGQILLIMTEFHKRISALERNRNKNHNNAAQEPKLQA